ncbi:hypothetical protein A3C20_02065 [Candidatus Kaiserbacteria bacterium RIFCSPHIGHO2_02_FULL_55_25]|uniref:Uncharacterized protein n=1 Tax=Candidatus Kaiserbacteria bacterium RIFCSPHIGHO2_02_FULL_55_25 TaxID=1798498 RepID=A0A1F6E475_9BACT|nr:MAG: hypothetical protein A2764_01545 [Candidatus Kaiserbacteria bacterium RIFCSPHIGHO2_01_FULL_55_79]OGG68499.1 MAG: hypothetical protein A3C20_02065 [Candidatus Kaiserbacteria bacterium RIFCSPHIGHO2_02_FULL_55_25]OGG77076.1 MAG: hypothetical protein A3F56_01740 [Candidatus Kaiserbacteria bacterium RIFCSPHIGHO2_12_FULL_55_13]OGG82783.1 MAG: hypothetical protein A3A42_02870 [Candidatus Kaiserbacteria bacterium RIFCSPLOWO2_01_FULL_55_25]
MWGTILAVNSVVIWPAAVVFLIYATGHSIIFWQWKLFVIAVVVFIIATIAQVVLGILTE